MESSNPVKMLIVGTPASGKSTICSFLKNQEKVLFLNTETAKPLPYKHNFKHIYLREPEKLFNTLKAAEQSDRFDTIVIDSLTCLMDRYHRLYMRSNENRNNFELWDDYAKFLIEMMEDYIASTNKNVIITAHVEDTIEDDGYTVKITKAALKGRVGKKGVEYFFSTVLATKVVAVTELLEYADKCSLLNVTDYDMDVGFKHVLQTRRSADTFKEIIRAPMDMFEADELYIDANAQLVIDRLNKFYGRDK